MHHVDMLSRRRFVQMNAGAFAAGWIGALAAAESKSAPSLHLASNEFSWQAFYRRDNRNFSQQLDAGIQDVAASGLNGLEPLVVDDKQLEAMIPLLKQHGLEMRSLYVNSTLHLQEQVEPSIAKVLGIAARAKLAGTQIIVTNPKPIKWGGTEDKNDAQLMVQAAALNQLGRKLAAMGLTLAYHNHDSELRNAAREFHHMLVATDPKFVTFCLDAHWIYRGSGNSNVALFDVVKLHGKRVTELHLRQSINGVWAETFGAGDIDYAALAEELKGLGIRPHLVLEQAPEKGTPKTLDPVEAHHRSLEYARRVMACWG